MSFRRFSTSCVNHSLKKPLYNFKLLRDVDANIANVKRREIPQLAEVLESNRNISNDYNQIKEQLVQLNTSKNQVQKQMKELVKQKKLKSGEFINLKKQASEIATSIKDVEKTAKEIESKVYNLIEALPNELHPSVKDEIEVIGYINPKNEYKKLESYQHHLVSEELNLIDFKSASEVSGARSYYLLGDLALLEQALITYAIKLATKSGFNFVTPPSIVRNDISNACGFKPRDLNNEVQTYQLPNEQCLTGTAEIPLAGLGLNKKFEINSLPKRVVGFSRSYRAEAGSAGRDTKGIYRVHEFNKVELFVWSKPQDSDQILDQLRDFQIEFIKSLGLTARVINIPANDLGAPASKKYDIEAWMQGRGDWGELTSTSNCTDFQARRFHSRYVNENGELEFVHTLNGTALAAPRVLVAIIETFYNPELKEIKIPEVLREYMDGKEFIEKQPEF